jgi:hypothetical protein
MTPDDIRPLLAADPFEKFFPHVSDGSSLEVIAPADVSFPPSGGLLLYLGKGLRVFVALGHIVSITFPSKAGDPFFLKGRS